MAKGEDRAAGFAADSLKGASKAPSQSGGPHAEAGDGTLSNRSLTGKEPDKEHAMTKNIPGARTNPEAIPQEGHGGSNTRGSTQHKQGKDGNGAQKRQQQKKS